MATTTDDPRYAELFDVRREAQGMSNVADTDFNPLMNALRERGPVLKGSLRELLGLGGDSRYDTDLPGYTALSFAACDRAFRENLLFSSEGYNDMPAVRKLGHVVLNKVGEPHKRMRAAAQSMFLKPAATGWWRRNWIDDAVNGLIDRLEGRTQADLNIDLCARLPLQVVSLGVGLEGDEALVFREQLLKSSVITRRRRPNAQRPRRPWTRPCAASSSIAAPIRATMSSRASPRPISRRWTAASAS